MNIPQASPTQTVTITVRAVLGTTARGGAVFSGISASGDTIRVIAAPEVLGRCPVAGEAWSVSGRQERHPKYGEQLVAESCRYQLPKGELLFRYLVDSVYFEGIGESKAHALRQKFGGSLAEVLSSGNVDALEAVLTRRMAERLVLAWAAKRPESELMAFLDEHGFDLRLASRLNRVWGSEARAMLELNPYYLLAFAGWPQVDSAAAKLGVPLDDERRLVGAVESALYDRLQKSHTLTDHASLSRAVRRKLRFADADRAISLALDELAIVGTKDDGYQPAGAAALERGIAERIRSMLGGETPEQLTVFARPGSDDVSDNLLKEVERIQGFQMNEEQRAAVTLPFNRSFCLLTGGAGVGKTTVLRGIVHLAKHFHLRVFQMALAGRAAKRMSEATGHEALTIAKFLSDAKAGRVEVNSDSIVVVDEASMMDLSTLYRILRHLPDGARLLLVGDPAQLAPIGFGLVFHRLARSDTVPQIHLIRVHRQAESSGIPTAALAIRGHCIPKLTPFSGRHVGVSFIECAQDEIIAVAREVTSHWRGSDWQILAAVKGGRGGLRLLNGEFHFATSGGNHDAGPLLPQEPVIHLLNDYTRGLMNGTLGHVIAIHEDQSVEFEFEGRTFIFEAHEVRDRVELAYAISVHKAQGSQFDRVVVAVTPSRLLDHALIYTSLTRAIEQVVFVGDRRTFENAVLRPPLANERQVGFSI